MIRLISLQAELGGVEHHVCLSVFFYIFIYSVSSACMPVQKHCVSVSLGTSTVDAWYCVMILSPY